MKPCARSLPVHTQYWTKHLKQFYLLIIIFNISDINIMRPLIKPSTSTLTEAAVRQSCFNGDDNYCGVNGVCRLYNGLRHCECHDMWTGDRCDEFDLSTFMGNYNEFLRSTGGQGRNGLGMNQAGSSSSSFDDYSLLLGIVYGVAITLLTAVASILLYKYATRDRLEVEKAKLTKEILEGQNLLQNSQSEGQTPGKPELTLQNSLNILRKGSIPLRTQTAGSGSMFKHGTHGHGALSGSISSLTKLQQKSPSHSRSDSKEKIQLENKERSSTLSPNTTWPSPIKIGGGSANHSRGNSNSFLLKEKGAVLGTTSTSEMALKQSNSVPMNLVPNLPNTNISQNLAGSPLTTLSSHNQLPQDAKHKHLPHSSLTHTVSALPQTRVKEGVIHEVKNKGRETPNTNKKSKDDLDEKQRLLRNVISNAV